MLRRLTPLALSLLLLALSAGPMLAAPTAWTRPVTDWLDAQQAVLDTTIPVELGPISWYEPDSFENYMADMDGRVAMWVAANGGPSLAPTITGSVHERLLSDGRSLVSVQLKFDHAITYIWRDENDFADFPAGPELFGYRASEIVAGATPVLGSGWFSLTFIHTDPGGPLPELGALAFEPEDGQEIISVGFHASARGPLRVDSGYAEGTPGQAATQQIGVFQASTPDGYPAEWVTYRPVGGN